MKGFAVISIFVIVASGCASVDGTVAYSEIDPFAASIAAMSGSEIRDHMEILAADKMEGREAGTDAFLAAANYVAAEFLALGLQPAGDAGYLQHVRFLETRVIPEHVSMIVHGDGFEDVFQFGKDFIRSGGFAANNEKMQAPLVFVGYGIRAPEYEHDDFSGVDVRGKVLVILTGAPPHFSTDERAYYSSLSVKQAFASERGATGILTIRTPVDQQRLPWSRYEAAVGSTDVRWLNTDGIPHEAYPELGAPVTLSESAAQRLFTRAGHNLEHLFETHESGQTGSVDLGMSIALAHRSIQQVVSSPNVVGLIRGSDPVLREEYVLYTAHLDHLGIRSGNDGDTIYNGAYDNAAGVAVMIEIAKAFANMRPLPRRSILFAAVTAEEKGLRGSDYLAHYPPVPIEQIVANINIDMPFLGFPIADIEGLGVEHSSLNDALLRATKYVGLTLTSDPRPELVRFIRSDQFSFVKRGVPGFNFKAGAQSRDSSVDGQEMQRAFLNDHYHRTSDDLELPFHHEAAEQFARAAALTGLVVANKEERPRWKPGDFFGDKFGRQPH